MGKAELLIGGLLVAIAGLGALAQIDALAQELDLEESRLEI